MIIRLANPSDHQAIQGLTRALAHALQEPAAPTFNKIYVAEDRQILGFAAIDAARVQAVYVSGGWRRSGIGSSLIRAIIEDVGPGVALSALVSPTNVVGQAFYRSLKFEPDVRLGEYAGHSEHLSLVLRT
jgi:ribosomal protein S18 acetylase RimI-like enzyme